MRKYIYTVQLLCYVCMQYLQLYTVTSFNNGWEMQFQILSNLSVISTDPFVIAPFLSDPFVITPFVSDVLNVMM